MGDQTSKQRIKSIKVTRAHRHRQQLSLIGRNFLRKKVRKSKRSDHAFSSKTGKCYTRGSFMRMGRCSVACVAKQGAKIHFHKKAAEILKPLPLLNMWQDNIIEKPFVFLHSKKMQKKKKEEKLMTAKEKGATKTLEVVKWIVNEDLPLSLCVEIQCTSVYVDQV